MRPQRQIAPMAVFANSAISGRSSLRAIGGTRGWKHHVTAGVVFCQRLRYFQDYRELFEQLPASSAA
jgi:hypothetical protein